MTESRPRLPSPPVGRQFGWVSGGNICAAMVQAVSYVLLARWTSLPEFGLVTAFLAVVVIVQTVMDLGIPPYVIRSRAADPQSPSIERAIRLNNVTSWATCALISVVLVLMAVRVDPTAFTLLPLSIWAAAERNTDVRLGVTLADGDARINGTSIVARRAGALALFVALHLLTSNAMAAYAIGSCVVAVAANVWARRLVTPRLRHGPDGATLLRTVLRESRPFWINSMATQARQADVLLTGLLAGTTQAAFYAAASRTTGPLRILPNSLAAVLMPAAARSRDGRPVRLLAPVVRLMSVIAVLYLGLAVAAPVLVPAVLGEDYAGTVLPLQIILVGLTFGALSSILGAVLQGLGHPQDTARASLGTTVLCLVGIAALASATGAVGAAAALAASFVLQATFLTVDLQFRLRRRIGAPGRSSCVK